MIYLLMIHITKKCKINIKFRNKNYLKVSDKSNRSNIDSFVEQSNIIMDVNNVEFVEKKKMKRKTNFGWKFHSKYYLYCRRHKNEEETQKQKAFKTAQDFIDKQLDIVNFLNYLNIVDAIKFLVFNKYQFLCFNHLKKLNLADEEDLKQIQSKIELPESKEENEIMAYFENRQRKGEITDVDAKLFDMIEKIIR
jgi:hypothetical protein